MNIYSMNKKIKVFILTSVLISLIGLTSGQAVLALTADDPYGLNKTATESNIPTSDNPNPFPEMVGSILGWALGILGVVFLVIIMIGGYIWMMAAGNEEKVRKAKTMIGAAMSGLFIIFVSYALAGAIITALIGASPKN